MNLTRIRELLRFSRTATELWSYRMRRFALCFLASAFAISAGAQQVSSTPRINSPTALPGNPDLSERLGDNDVVGISVYDSPELSRSIRIDSQGNIRLPMVQQSIHAAGLAPSELENAISSALVDEHIMIHPVVSISVVEYHSKPITIAGAVHSPMTFQAPGPITLLDAITRAGGISENAGSEILVSHPSAADSSIVLTDRIGIHALLNGSNPAANTLLMGGENIRVPEAGRIFVVGNVKRPGPFLITDDSESSILKALSIAGGLDSFSSHTAYIYRIDGSTGHKNEIPVNVHRIMARKSPDVPLFANDMLYVPNATGARVSAKTLEITGGIGIATAAFILYALR